MGKLSSEQTDIIPWHLLLLWSVAQAFNLQNLRASIKLFGSAINIKNKGAFPNQFNALETPRHALSYIQSTLIDIIALIFYEQKENVQFFATFGSGRGLKWRFSNFSRFRKT